MDVFATRLTRNLVLGVAGGIAGTVVMDALQYVRYRRTGGESSPLEWEFGGVDSWEDVSAPGQVAEAILTAATGHAPSDRLASPAQAITHWGTGAGWGAALGLTMTVRTFPWWVAGPMLGLKAWLTSYVVLPPLGIYRPIWKYDVKTLAPDLGVHLLYGSTAALVFGALRGRRQG